PTAAPAPGQPEPVATAAPEDPSLEPIAAAASAAANAAGKPGALERPVGGVAAVKSRSEAARPDAAKTLKCPECGTANYPTEWYCVRGGGEVSTSETH